MGNRIRFLLDRLRERLWVRPLIFCVLSVAAALLAKTSDRLGLEDAVPTIVPESLETLLGIVASSMLVIATFAVASMVSAYASASTTATPRSFPLIVSDDVSQNALSAFIGTFIFCIVALIALLNGYYGRVGTFVLFLIALGVFASVILTFVTWVDRIARLGRLGATVDKVEEAAAEALRRRRCSPNLGGAPVDDSRDPGTPIHASKIGYVQHIDIDALQSCAEELSLEITVQALPGAFSAPGSPIAYFTADGAEADDIDTSKLAAAFEIGPDRVFEGDPRFGLIALSEIASRALSPAVNDPGTAIDIVGTFLRLFASYVEPLENATKSDIRCQRVHVPELSLRDMFDDAFTSIARDGASSIEVQVRLQKALGSLASVSNGALADAAIHHSRMALARAERGLTLSEDLDTIRAAARWSAPAKQPGSDRAANA